MKHKRPKFLSFRRVWSTAEQLLNVPKIGTRRKIPAIDTDLE